MDFGFAAPGKPGDKAGAPGIPPVPGTMASAPASTGMPEGNSKLLSAAQQYTKYDMAQSKTADPDSVMTIIVYGSKDAGKSCAPAGLKVRQGGRKVIISCDNTTEEALRNYYGPEFYDSCELYEPARRRVAVERNPDGTIKRGPDGRPLVTETYPGYDPKRPWTAELVLSKISELMAKLQKEGDVEIFILDHYQLLYEKIAATYARFKAGRGPSQRMQLEDWQWRSESMDYLESEIRNLPMPGGIAVITGYGPEEKTTYGDEVILPGGQKKRPVVTEVTTPKWLNKNTVRQWHVVLDMSYVDEKEQVVGAQVGNQRYFCEVVASKTPRFPKGVKVEITNKSLELFWTERHLLPKAEEPMQVTA